MSRIVCAASLAFFAPFLALTALPAAAQKEQVLESFKNPNLGNPLGRLLLQGGALYGTASGFGASANGQVFTLTPSGSKWVEKSIVKFDGTDGSEPFAGLMPSSGTLYGTTALGGSAGCGNVFSVRKAGSSWRHSTIWTFQGGAGDACQPLSDLVMDGSGNIYGTAGGGDGTANCSGGCGTVFELSPQTGGGWSETILYNFQDGSDGAVPRGGLLLDKAGNLFGTTAAGAGRGCLVGCGTVFELSPDGSGWNFSTIHTFDGTDGGMPWGVLIEDSKGTLYGTTTTGGTFGEGTAFALAQSKGTWSETLLYNFRGGSTPQGGLISNGSGGFYGTAFAGGQSGCLDGGGCGLVFELTKSKGAWSEFVLYSFSGGKDGGNPAAAVILDKSGNLYSTTYEGGRYGYGTVWKITP